MDLVVLPDLAGGECTMVKDSIHDQFDESVEAYMDGAKAKKRVNKKCKH